jgi:hypothetical protein
MRAMCRATHDEHVASYRTQIAWRRGSGPQYAYQSHSTGFGRTRGVTAKPNDSAAISHALTERALTLDPHRRPVARQLGQPLAPVTLLRAGAPHPNAERHIPGSLGN